MLASAHRVCATRSLIIKARHRLTRGYQKHWSVFDTVPDHPHWSSEQSLKYRPPVTHHQNTAFTISDYWKATMAGRSRHLKEEDELYNYVLDNVDITADESSEHHIANVLSKLEKLMLEHVHDPAGSELRKICPHIGHIFVQLDMRRALTEYDKLSHITLRRFVPPTFAEIRKIFNLAVVHSIAKGVKLVTLDADDTIYADGLTLTVDSPIIPLITKLMVMGCEVSLVTAAGYPGEPHKAEARIAGLLRAFAYALECGAPVSFIKKFHIMGGECNYLLEPEVEFAPDGLNPRVYLREIPDEEWKDGRGVRWDHEDVAMLLDTAEKCLRETAETLNLDVLVIRKERAVGIIQNPSSSSSLPGAYGRAAGKLTYAVLEECALAVQRRLRRAGIKIPHCAFNGGHDVFIDVGHKALGIRALQARVGAKPEETVHAGDRFSRTGNDLRSRDVANTLWVDSPAETEYLLTLLIADMRNARQALPVAQVQEETTVPRGRQLAVPIGDIVPTPEFGPDLATPSSDTMLELQLEAPQELPGGSPPTAGSRSQSVGPGPRGISSGASDAVPNLYGMTVERAIHDAATNMKDQLRSQWGSTGGKVVAVVTPTARGPVSDFSKLAKPAS